RHGRSDRDVRFAPRPQPKSRRADRARHKPGRGDRADRPDRRGAHDRTRAPRPGAPRGRRDAHHGGRLRRARGAGEARRGRRGPPGPKAEGRVRATGTPPPMSGSEFLFTSESVTEGHPDKVADQVSDAVLDAVLRDDPNGRVACETLVTTGLVVVAGEMTTSTYVDIPRLVRDRIPEIGYTRAKYGFDAEAGGAHLPPRAQS